MSSHHVGRSSAASVISQLLKNRHLNNVGVVKTFSSTLRHPLRAGRHFALVEICQANLRLASNRCGSGTQSDPTISSIATSIMITTSNSPVKGSGMPNHYGGDLLHTMGISGLSRVRTELLHFGVVPAAPPHPVQLDRQLSRHRDLGDLPSAPVVRKVEFKLLQIK